MLRLLLHELRSRVGAVVGWGVGLTAFGAMYITIFPEVSEQMQSMADFSIYRAMGMEMATFEGYIASVVILFVPLLLGIYAIVTSTKTLAGEEDSGTLELLLATPLSRTQIVSMKSAAIAIIMAAILVLAGFGNALVLIPIKQSVEVGIAPMQLLGAVVSAWPLVMAFAMIGLFLGAFLPSRRLAAMTTTVLFVASYFGENISEMVASLEPIKPFSLFTYFDSTSAIFTEGLDFAEAGLLVGIAALFFVLTLVSFGTRNVTTGAWPWQRGRPEIGASR